MMAGHVFTDPESGVLTPRVSYLSGNVRTKLAAARQGVESGGNYAGNVAALEAVLPEDVDIRDVVVNPGDIIVRVGAAPVSSAVEAGRERRCGR